MFRGRGRTSVVLSKNSIAPAGEIVVHPIAQRTRQNAYQSYRPPYSPQPADGPGQRVRAHEGAFIGLAKTPEDDDCVQFPRAESMAPEQIARQSPLQGSEAKLIVAVMAEQELHQPVAEPANSIVEHEGVRSRRAMLKN